MRAPAGVVEAPPDGRQGTELPPDSASPAAPPRAVAWGALPALSLVSACGVLLVACAYTAARFSLAWASPLFWGGVLVLFVPLAARLGTSAASWQERLGLVLVLGSGLYLVKVLRSPVAFTSHDELLHWRTANDIVQSTHLYGRNSLLPVSPLYPGLENVTAALVSLGRLPIFSAGVIVIGVARLVLVATLFLFYREIGRSARVAGLAALLYMANPHFVFFDAQFAYESLALPLAAVCLLAAARCARARDGRRLGLTLAALLALGAVVITHHVTTYALTAFLLLWTAMTVVMRRAGRERSVLPGLTALAVVMGLAWLIYVASLTVGYLAPNLSSALGEIIQIITGEVTARRLFRAESGLVNPLWERLTGFAAVGLILLGLPFGLWRIWRRRRRADAVVLALAVGALAYPASLAFRFAKFGAEVSSRTSPFLFVSIAFVLAVGGAELWLYRGRHRQRAAAFAACATVVFLGGVIVGRGPSALALPGPYVVAADDRSIEAQGLAAAEWTRLVLGPGNRVASDRVNRLLLGSYGGQAVATALTDGVNVYPVFFSRVVDREDRELLRRGAVRYLVVDRRLSAGLPQFGIYFEPGEPGEFQRRIPLDPAALAKFDGLPGVHRLFDSGDIVIYDVGALAGEP